MAIAEAGSLSYKLPQQGAQRFIQPPAPVEPLAPAQGEAMLPPLNEDLAQVQGLTERYYDNYGKLKSFVESMNSQGLDVTKPAYGDPARMELFNTYKMLEANLITTAQQLKEHQRQRKIKDPLEAQGKFAWTEDPNTTLGAMGYSTDLDPFVEQVNRNLSVQPFTEDAAKRQEALYQDAIGQINTRIGDIKKKGQLTREDQNEIARLTYQKNQITKTYQGDKVFAESTPSASWLNYQAEVEGAGEILKQATRVLRGVDYDTQKIVNGKAAGISNQYTGFQMSPEKTMLNGKGGIIQRKIAFTYMTADGKIFAKFEPTKVINKMGEPIGDEEIVPPDAEIGNREPLSFIQELSDNNDKFIKNYNEFAENTKAAKLVDKGVTLEQEALKGTKKSELPTELDRKMKELDGKLKKLEKVGSGPIEILVGKNKIKIAPQQTTKKIFGIEWTPSDSQRSYKIYVDGVEQGEATSIEGVKQWFEENDLYDIIFDTSTKPVAQQKQSSEIDEDI